MARTDDAKKQATVRDKPLAVLHNIVTVGFLLGLARHMHGQRASDRHWSGSLTMPVAENKIINKK